MFRKKKKKQSDETGNKPVSSVVAGDFSLKNKLKKLFGYKKTNSQPINNPVPSKAKSRSFVARRQIFKFKIVLIFIVAAIIGLGVYFYKDDLVGIVQKSDNTEHTCQNPASEKCHEILNNSVKALNDNNIKKQAEIVEQIKKEPNYTKEPNYMFVVTRYYINIGDPKNSKANYEKLNEAYSKEEGYNKIIRSIAATPGDLQLMIKYLEQQADQAQKNFYGVPPPSQ